MDTPRSQPLERTNYHALTGSKTNSLIGSFRRFHTDDLTTSTLSWSTSYSWRSSAVILASPSTSPSSSPLALTASRGLAKVTRAWEGV